MQIPAVSLAVSAICFIFSGVRQPGLFCFSLPLLCGDAHCQLAAVKVCNTLSSPERSSLCWSGSGGNLRVYAWVVRVGRKAKGGRACYAMVSSNHREVAYANVTLQILNVFCHNNFRLFYYGRLKGWGSFKVYSLCA